MCSLKLHSHILNNCIFLSFSRYSTLYTMYPVFSLVLDKDVKPETALTYPELYKELTKVLISYYHRCFKILNTSCRLIRPEQTVQTQIRLQKAYLMSEIFHSSRVCYSERHFVSSSSDSQHFNLEYKERKKKTFVYLP